jgi:hypothetical protein
VLNNMKSQVLSKYVQQMKTIRLRIVGIENMYEIKVALFIKEQSSQGVHPKSTRIFNSITNLTTEYMSLNYCLSLGITLAYNLYELVYKLLCILVTIY